MPALIGLVDLISYVVQEWIAKSMREEILLGKLLGEVRDRFEPLYNRFIELWLRSERPRGLEPNKALFLKLKQSIDNSFATLMNTK